MSELEKQGKLYKKLTDLNLYTIEDFPSGSETISGIYQIKQILNEAKKDLEFNENEPMWKDYLSAEVGESGDYPDETDFMLWLVEEDKKLLSAKKKWFGEVK